MTFNDFNGGFAYKEPTYPEPISDRVTDTPEPAGEQPLYVNDPHIADDTLRHSVPPEALTMDLPPEERKLKDEFLFPDDNIRLYVPLDLNARAIMRRLHHLISKYGSVTWQNESSYSTDVGVLIDQLDLYDQLWEKRHTWERRISSDNGAANAEGSEYTGHWYTDGDCYDHSPEGIALAMQFIEALQGIDGIGDMFPYQEIEELSESYLGHIILDPARDEFVR